MLIELRYFQATLKVLPTENFIAVSIESVIL